MEEQILKNPDVEISAELLARELGKLYPVYREFIDTIESENFRFTPEWRYYKDGKAWLCKITYKKKTVAWLSLWKHCIKVGLYFTEKSGKGIETLDISDSLKKSYREHPLIGKLKPVVSEISKKSQLGDVYALMRYKSEIR